MTGTVALGHGVVAANASNPANPHQTNTRMANSAVPPTHQRPNATNDFTNTTPHCHTTPHHTTPHHTTLSHHTAPHHTTPSHHTAPDPRTRHVLAADGDRREDPSYL